MFMQTIVKQGASDFIFDQTKYPLISLIDFANEKNPANYKLRPGLYYIFISPAGSQGGRLLFSTPHQLVEVSCEISAHLPVGQALVFHSDLLQDTSIADCLTDYSFFRNSTNKALPLSAEEYQLALDYLANIKMELTHTADKHSKRLIASNIELFLNNCDRFFSRKFIMAENNHTGIMQRLDQMLRRYFTSESPFKFGIPSVAYCASELHLSAKYFGSLVKKETGKTAQQYIRDKILTEAKDRINVMDKTINEVAYELGFKYPQHFSRYFKKVIGQTPNTYKQRLVLAYNI